MLFLCRSHSERLVVLCCSYVEVIPKGWKWIFFLLRRFVVFPLSPSNLFPELPIYNVSSKRVSNWETGTAYSEHLRSPPIFFFGGVRIANLFSFLCCVICLSFCTIYLHMYLDCPFWIGPSVFSNVVFLMNVDYMCKFIKCFKWFIF